MNEIEIEELLVENEDLKITNKILLHNIKLLRQNIDNLNITNKKLREEVEKPRIKYVNKKENEKSD